MQGLVSIIVPVYNGKNRIMNALNSIQKQSYKNWEIIIVDDGSTDGTSDLVDKFAMEEKRCQVVHVANQGVSQAKNEGLRHASGEYIQFLDHDDSLMKHATKKLVEAMESDQETDMVVGTYIKRYPGYYIKQSNVEKCGSYSGKEYLENTLVDPGHFYYGVNWNKLYRREVLAKNEIFFDSQINLGEDFIFNLEVLKHARKVKTISSVLVLYDCRSSGLSRNSFQGIERCKNELRNRKKIWERYMEAFDYFGIRDKHWKQMKEYWMNFKTRQQYNLDFNFLDWDEASRDQWLEIIDNDPVVNGYIDDIAVYESFKTSFYRKQKKKDLIKKIIRLGR